MFNPPASKFNRCVQNTNSYLSNRAIWGARCSLEHRQNRFKLSGNECFMSRVPSNRDAITVVTPTVFYNVTFYFFFFPFRLYWLRRGLSVLSGGVAVSLDIFARRLRVAFWPVAHLLPLPNVPSSNYDKLAIRGGGGDTKIVLAITSNTCHVYRGNTEKTRSS